MLTGLSKFIPQLAFGFLSFVLLPLVMPHSASAEGWQMQLTDQGAIPQSFLVIDKKAQQVHMLNKHSPLAVSATYPCTTGKVPGDKQSQDDLKTPEGVYFVGRKLTQLDFNEYGGVAYTLNYPNPVDRLRQKTGYGIWVHSKGHNIIPLETKGCIALNLSDLETIGNSLTFNYPVTVADSVDTKIGKNENLTAIAETLTKRVDIWAKLWSGRSTELFNLYHGQSYSMAQPDETFEHFKTNKKSLFQRLPWIHTIITDVQMLPGPGYWVTWFNQFYRAPNMTTEGVRRLYWQEKDGQWLIVGMEWEPRDMGLSAYYLEYIEPDLTKFIENWRTAWEKGNIEEYAQYYSTNASQGKLHSQNAIREHKQNIWNSKKPTRVELNGIRLATSSGGIQADMEQIYKDSSGYQDKGIKTLTLQPSGEGWVITQEEWQAADKR